MSRLELKFDQPGVPPVSLLHEVKSGGVFFFKSSYMSFGPKTAELFMANGMPAMNVHGEFDRSKVMVVSLSDGAVIPRPRNTEVIQMNAEILIGKPHGVEK
jgi:hypothetical protein